MSALLATPLVIPVAMAVSDALPRSTRPAVKDGAIFYRKRTLALLHRYLRTSMDIGRAPCVLGNSTFRGRASHHRLRTFEDSLIFVFDVEKCLKRLDRVSQAVIAHVALEDYTPPEAAAITGESLRTVTRIYGEAMDRLTRLFIAFGLLESNVENLSSPRPKIQSNDATKQKSCKATEANKVGAVILRN